ncbi:MAG: hypothetical protein LCI00_24005 [Chloroflexi bacterium]|nr:hypothetical protein [Chloroflexota bacterium]MCC6896122.1 hypothetical protein [Anaerolineae bacterium]
MSLDELVTIALDKRNFQSLDNYIAFCTKFLDFAVDGLQAVIISQNENHYRFYQYKEDGHFNITRPLNADLLLVADDNSLLTKDFREILREIRDIPESDTERRSVIIRAIYTIQQSIGAVLDALPSGAANTARKINGDLFERLIQLLVRAVGVECKTGTIQVPVEVDGEIQFFMNYQHDLLLLNNDELKAIGSVKTSSKDRIDKIFMDKFLYSKLTGTTLPHIAIFLNDVQRKQTRQENHYGVSTTFLPGHFKGYTVKLNPLDGVYYCDIRPNMRTEPILKDHIQTIDYFFCTDLWDLTKQHGADITSKITMTTPDTELTEITIEPDAS